MSIWFRAVVMLTVLVGLPAAWFNYGPLPPPADRVVSRVVNAARMAIGVSPLPASDLAAAPSRLELGGTAPLFDAAPEELNSEPPATTEDGDEVFGPSAAAWEETVSSPRSGSGERAAAIERLLSELRKLGAAEYDLQQWGSGNSHYRFVCAIPLAGSLDHTQHFEAVASDPLASVEKVMTEVSAWQLARQAPRRLR